MQHNDGLKPLQDFNATLTILVDQASHLPRIRDYGNEEEALSHAIAIRLGQLERRLKKRSIFPASSDTEIMALDHRIQGLNMQGVNVVSPLVINQE